MILQLPNCLRLSYSLVFYPCSSSHADVMLFISTLEYSYEVREETMKRKEETQNARVTDAEGV